MTDSSSSSLTHPKALLLEPIQTRGRKDLRPYHEFRLLQWPDCYAEFLECFRDTNGDLDRKRVLWTDDSNCLVQLDSYFYGEIGRPNYELCITTSSSSTAKATSSTPNNQGNHQIHFFSLYSKTALQDSQAQSTLNGILQLLIVSQSQHLESNKKSDSSATPNATATNDLVMIHKVSISTSAAGAPCPIHNGLLQQLVQVGILNLEWDRMRWNNVQSRILATATTKAMTFVQCEFDASRVFATAFVQEAEQRTDHRENAVTRAASTASPVVTGPAHLTFRSVLPLTDSDLRLMVQHDSSPLQSLHFSGLALSAETLRIIFGNDNESEENTHYLDRLGLADCQMHDEQASNVILQVIRGNHLCSPRGLDFEFRGFHGGDDSHFSRFPFESTEQWDALCQAVSCNRILQTVLIRMQLEPWEDLGDAFLPPLLTTLQQNQTLQGLVISNMSEEVANELIPQVFHALAGHPTIAHVQFTTSNHSNHPDRDDDALVEKQHLTRQAEDLLLVNRSLEHITFQDNLYDASSWQQNVLPRLQVNRYRKCVPTLVKNIDPHDRAAKLAAVLASIRDKTPSVTWMFLRDNQDLVAHCLCHAL